MRSYRTGEAMSTIDLAQKIRQDYGVPYLVVHRVDLHNVLAKEAEKHGASIRVGADVTGVVAEGVARPVVELASGERIDFDVVLGADGERSVCRILLLGQAAPLRDSGDHVFRITVPSNEVLKHDNLAGLIEPPNITCWVGPGGNAITYRLRRDDLLNVVLTREHVPGAQPQLIPQRIGISEVSREFDGWNPIFQSVLNLAKECSRWTLLESDIVSRWTNEQGNFALLGDAAHAMLPFLYVRAQSHVQIPVTKTPKLTM
jgi:salicylate hydroxylase